MDDSSSQLQFRQIDSDTTGAYQTFTAYSAASNTGVSGAPFLGPVIPSYCGCTGNPNPFSGCEPCTYSVQALNSYDWDGSVGGIGLFNDLSGKLRAVTPDKAGYGYLLTPGQLCGSGIGALGCVGFQSGDPGSWTFGASSSLCQYIPGKAGMGCDRIPGLAIFDNQGSNSIACGSTGGRCVYLNYWPNNERLTSLKLSDNSTEQIGNGMLVPDANTSDTNYQYKLLLASSCTPNSNCLGEQVVAGNTLTLPAIQGTSTGCACSGSVCPPVVTKVESNSTGTYSAITLNVQVSTAFNCVWSTTGFSFAYTGYFVTPAHDANPNTPDAVGYPGAAVTISANCNSAPTSPCTNPLIWSILPGDESKNGSMDRGLGTLYSYSALPNINDILRWEWNSADAWCASSFARPTIVNARAFVATHAVSCPQDAVGCRTTLTLSSCTNDGQKGSLGALATDASGALYGTTVQGGRNLCVDVGCGIVFKLARESGGMWKYSILHNFANGAAGNGPGAGVTLDVAGNLYGTTIYGGTCCGVVYKLSPTASGPWKYTVLHRFTGADGAQPDANLVIDSAGNLYGTTAPGGAGGYGVAFQVKP